MSFSKKIISFTTLLILPLFSVLIYSSNISPKVYAANGTATITNNAITSMTVGVTNTSGEIENRVSPVATLYVCVNNESLGVLAEGASVDFSGAAGTYDLRVYDVQFVDIATIDCTTLQDVIYPVLVTSTEFSLLDDCLTEIEVSGQVSNNGTFSLYSDLNLISVSNSPEVQTRTRIRVTDTANNEPLDVICINGNPYLSNEDGYVNIDPTLVAGTVIISPANIPAFNCVGANLNPGISIDLTAGTTTEFETFLQTEMAFATPYATTGITTTENPSRSCTLSSSSSMSVSSMSMSRPSAPRISLIRTGGSDK